MTGLLTESAFPALPHVDESYARDSWDYWRLPECPQCHATLAADGTHWAAGRKTCPSTFTDKETTR